MDQRKASRICPPFLPRNLSKLHLVQVGSVRKVEIERLVSVDRLISPSAVNQDMSEACMLSSLSLLLKSFAKRAGSFFHPNFVQISVKTGHVHSSPRPARAHL